MQFAIYGVHILVASDAVESNCCKSGRSTGHLLRYAEAALATNTSPCHRQHLRCRAEVGQHPDAQAHGPSASTTSGQAGPSAKRGRGDCAHAAEMGSKRRACAASASAVSSHTRQPEACDRAAHASVCDALNAAHTPGSAAAAAAELAPAVVHAAAAPQPQQRTCAVCACRYLPTVTQPGVRCRDCLYAFSILDNIVRSQTNVREAFGRDSGPEQRSCTKVLARVIKAKLAAQPAFWGSSAWTQGTRVSKLEALLEMSLMSFAERCPRKHKQ